MGDSDYVESDEVRCLRNRCRSTRFSGVSRAMHVLMVGPYPLDGANPSGGVESATLHLVDGLNQLQAMRVTIVDARPRFTAVHDSISDRGVRVVRIPAGSAFGRARRVRSVVAQTASEIRADLVHMQGWASFVPEGLPSVMTVHGVVERSSALDDSVWRRSLKYPVETRGELRARGRQRCFICISEYVYQLIGDSPKKRRWMIPNAVGAPEATLGHVGDRDSCTLLFAGFIGRRKNVKDALQALARLRARFPRVELTVAGAVRDQRYFRECLSLAESLEVADRVAWLGPTSQGDLWDLMTRSSVLLLPSLEETAPMVVGEALRSGLPVVGYNVGGVAEMLTGTRAGYLVEKGDVEGLAAGASRYLDSSDPLGVVTDALLAGRKYSPEIVASATLEAYGEVMGGPSWTSIRRPGR